MDLFEFVDVLTAKRISLGNNSLFTTWINPSSGDNSGIKHTNADSVKSFNWKKKKIITLINDSNKFDIIEDTGVRLRHNQRKLTCLLIKTCSSIEFVVDEIAWNNLINTNGSITGDVVDIFN